MILHRTDDSNGHYKLLQAEPLPQITAENYSIYNDVIDSITDTKKDENYNEEMVSESDLARDEIENRPISRNRPGSERSYRRKQADSDHSERSVRSKGRQARDQTAPPPRLSKGQSASGLGQPPQRLELKLPPRTRQISGSARLACDVTTRGGVFERGSGGMYGSDRDNGEVKAVSNVVRKNRPSSERNIRHKNKEDFNNRYEKNVTNFEFILHFSMPLTDHPLELTKFSHLPSPQTSTETSLNRVYNSRNTNKH